MSEAHDHDLSHSVSLPLYEPRLRFTPDIELGGELKKFFTPELRTKALGQRGLFLFSEGVTPPSPRHGFDSMGSRREAINPALAGINRMLRERGKRHRMLAKRLQFERLPKEAPGVSIKMDVLLDELTARALIGTMELNPDYSIGVQLEIGQRHLAVRDEFLAASEGLYQKLLDGDSRMGVDVVELIERPVK